MSEIQIADALIGVSTLIIILAAAWGFVALFRCICWCIVQWCEYKRTQFLGKTYKRLSELQPIIHCKHL